jgi:CheY-like chemotaxis protein
MSILVADDNVDAALTLAQLLALDGYEVQTAHDGLEALSCASRWRPDVALLDVAMPKLSGCEVAERLRKAFLPNDMLLVSLCGDPQDEDCEAIDAHFMKPVDCDELIRLMQRWRAGEVPGR